MKNKLAASALALSLLATPVVAVQAAATSDPSEALASYIFQHAADSDKQVLIQWATWRSQRPPPPARSRRFLRAR